MSEGKKVQRAIKKYDLEDLGDELVERWTNSNDAESLHDLEQYVNRRIVESIIDEQIEGLVPQVHPPSRIAYLLQADASAAKRFEDASEVEITKVRNWFEQNDIDPNGFVDDFVSYNTVYQYLKNIKKVSASDEQRHSQNLKEQQEKVCRRISNIQQRVEAVTRQGLSSLVNVGTIPESYDIRIQFRIECTKCDRRQDLFEYIDNQGCAVCDANTHNEQ